ncbi:MAG TPA: hypothetical protein VED24_00925 [Candidatus Acidoferrum sp.]|nr:hypothetical protein [Candidatus Acidoferrum sp.]
MFTNNRRSTPLELTVVTEFLLVITRTILSSLVLEIYIRQPERQRIVWPDRHSPGFWTIMKEASVYKTHATSRTFKERM